MCCNQEYLSVASQFNAIVKAIHPIVVATSFGNHECTKACASPCYRDISLDTVSENLLVVLEEMSVDHQSQ